MTSASYGTPISSRPAGKTLRVALWTAQCLVALAFCASGAMKLTTPIPELSAMMPWAGQYPVAFVRTIGLIDLAGGLGILLPALSRILPRLTVWAALGCTVLQLFAIAFHLGRGEAMVLPLNFVLLPLCAFVLWGRARRAPIRARGG
ncbi:DoxX family protein [Acidovorax sp. NCPPB 4044]|uniref:DoxX family protein n=1 Tax=Acidovorax sp. NCPPB 4044 TaxID=2940490 RepID=UPI00230338BA|nr:DoxX family protein [Acidovorax sp. NCPPB 4044]MDA8523131.1 DoxX family protein [Acidovorax sp. NCPPB 4044]